MKDEDKALWNMMNLVAAFWFAIGIIVGAMIGLSTVAIMLWRIFG